MNQFETSLKQTGAGYFDYYLLHNLGESRTQFFDDFDMWSWIQEKKKEGLVKNAGFSFHSTPEELEELLLAHPEAVSYTHLQKKNRMSIISLSISGTLMIALAILISSINLPAMLRQSYPLDENFQIGIRIDNFYERFPTIIQDNPLSRCV